MGGYKMTRLRYLIAGLLACLLHGIALSYTPQKNTINVSMNEGTQALQVQLMTIAAAKPVAETEPVQDQKVTEPTPEQPIKQAQKPVKPATPKPKEVSPKPKEISKPTSKPVAAKKPPPKPQKTVQEKPKKPATKPEPAKASKAEPNETAAPKTDKQVKPSTQDNKPMLEQKPMLVSKPKFSAKPTPVTYPRVARKRGLEGKVLVEVWLDEKGNQIKQVLLESSGHRVLDQRALSTIKEWRFSRQVNQGQAIAHRVQIPINFQLQ